MKTRYKFIHFEKCAPNKVNWLWACLNNKSKTIMGLVIFWVPWKHHVIEFQEDCIFNNQCLRDIADFLEQLDNEMLNQDVQTENN